MNLFSYLFAIGRVAAARVLGKKALAYTVVGLADDAQADNAEQSIDSPVFSALGHYGFPEPPSSSSDPMIGEGYADAFSVRMGDNLIPFGTRDTRLTARTNPATGAVGLNQYGGGYLDLRWDRDRQGTVVSLSAPRLDNSGSVTSAHYLSMDPADANNAVILAHRLGQGVVLNKNGDAVLKSANGNHCVSATNAGVVLSGKMNFVGGVVAGTQTLAQPLARAQEVIDCVTELLTIVTALSTQIKAVPTPGAGVDAQLLVLADKLAALSTTGTCTTVKGSPT